MVDSGKETVMSMNDNDNKPAPESKSFEPEIAADDAGATTLVEKMARKAPDSQVDADEKARLAKEASRQSDA
jgi:hypothetical protein